MSLGMHARDTADVAAALCVDPRRGLAAGEAVRRGVHFGRNVIHAAGASRRWARFVIGFVRAPQAAVVRVLCDGEETFVRAADLVPGDVIVVDAGMDLPADARILTASGLVVDEAKLTGTGAPALKSPDTVAENAPLTERRSMLYAGTYVTSGHATAIVTATGHATELGKIS